MSDQTATIVILVSIAIAIFVVYRLHKEKL